MCSLYDLFFFSSRRRHTRCALVTGVQTCALPISAYFYAPNDVKTKGVEPGRAIRLGGMVVQGSLARAADGVTIHFDVTDGKATVPAIFNGIAPDLFKEGSGVIAEGAFDQSGTFEIGRAHV